MILKHPLEISHGKGVLVNADWQMICTTLKCASRRLSCGMKKQKARDNFWFVLGIINILAMVYPMSSYLKADGIEDQVLAVVVLIGVGLVLAIVDTVSIAVAYSQ